MTLRFPKSLKKPKKKYLQTASLHPHSGKKADSVKISQKEALAPDMMEQHFFLAIFFMHLLLFLGLFVFVPKVREGKENLSIKSRSNCPGERTKYFFAHHQSYL